MEVFRKAFSQSYKSIFVNTQVPLQEDGFRSLLLKQVNKRTIPNIHRRSKSTNSLPRLVKENKVKKIDWKSFIKRNFYTGNYKPSNSLNISRRVQSLLQTANTKVQQQDINRKFNNRIKEGYIMCLNRLETNQNIEMNIKNIQKKIFQQKNLYNQLKSLNSRSQNKLQELNSVLDNIQDFQAPSINNLQKKLQFRKQQERDLQKGLQSEFFYQKCLKNMLNTRRDSIKHIQKPNNQVTKSLKILNEKCIEKSKNLKKIKQQILQLNREYSDQKTHQQFEKTRSKEEIKCLLKVYQDKCFFNKCLNYEYIYRKNLVQQKSEVKKILSIEKEIRQDKQEQVLQQELLQIEKLLSEWQMKFSIIQKVTNIVHIKDMLPYYQYLVQNQQRLNDQAIQNLNRIKKLQSKKKNKATHLKKIKFLRGETQPRTVLLDIERTEISMNQKQRNLVISKEELVNLQHLIVHIQTGIDKVYQQLKLPNIKRQPKNCIKKIAYIYLRFQKMLEFLSTQEIVQNIQSVNTQLADLRSPEFLNLMKQNYQEQVYMEERTYV